MLLGMHGPAIAERSTPLDGSEELVRAPAAAQPRADAEDALGALGELHARMLRAEVRAMFARRTTAGR